MAVPATSRIRIISIFFALFALVLITKLYLLQIVHGTAYAERAERQYVQPAGDVFSRGSIFFTSKDGTLQSAAALQSGFTIAINPKILALPEDAFAKLSPLIPLDHTDFIARATKQNDTYEEIGKRVTKDIADKISALKLAGVSVINDKWRFYPGGTLGAHALGFVGYKGDILTGRYGLEQYYNDVLSRTVGGLNVNFFAELFSDLGSTISDSSKQAGDIETTIEPSVQDYLQKQLIQVRKDWNPDEVGGIIINPKTGEIYAMAIDPTFDPNTYNKEKDAGVFTDDLVESRYEMGSIIKPLTMAAGIDSGAVTADSTYDDTGCIELNTKKICNFDHVARGVIPMQEILSQSLNVGAAYVAQKTGDAKFTEYFHNFGFGDETGIDLPGEVHGDISNLDSGREVEHATASFGQGIAMTPIETARALSALANGGLLPNPHLVKQIDYDLGYSKSISFGDEKRVFSAKTADEVTRMLVQVVDKALQHGAVALPHTSVAAKTGTAQIANPAGGGYYTDRYLHSFFGYFPAYDPKFLVFLYQVYPKGAQYASATLTSPFINITKFLINYYAVPPDR